MMGAAGVGGTGLFSVYLLVGCIDSLSRKYTKGWIICVHSVICDHDW